MKKDLAKKVYDAGVEYGYDFAYAYADSIDIKSGEDRLPYVFDEGFYENMEEVLEFDVERSEYDSVLIEGVYAGIRYCLVDIFNTDFTVKSGNYSVDIFWSVDEWRANNAA